MAKIFLDTNVLIDFIERKNISLSHLRGHEVAISPLSTHILFYVGKNLVPQTFMTAALEQFMIAPLTATVHGNSLVGPTNDFEDNIQLHSAAFFNASIFITNDKRLCAMKFFGSMKIIKPEEMKLN